MLRVLGNVILGVLVLMLAYVAFVAAMRLVPTTAARQAAIDTLTAPLPPLAPDKDAFALYWLADYDIPAEETAAVLADDVARFRRVVHTPAELTFATGAASRYRKLPVPKSTDAGLCVAGSSCLATVRANPSAVQSLLARHAPLLAKGLTLPRHDGLRTPLENNVSVFPPYGRFSGLVRTHFAAGLVAGQADASIAGVCRDLSAQRRIGSNTNVLIAYAMSSAQAASDIDLLAEMMAELPTDTALPADCTEALRPARPPEASLCMAMHGEYAFMSSMLFSPQVIAPKEPKTAWERVTDAWMDRQHTMELTAPMYAAACGEAARDAAARGVAWSMPESPAGQCSVAEKLADPTGCLLAKIAQVNDGLAVHQNRRVDVLARVQVVRAAAWLRDRKDDARPVAERWASRPADVRTAAGREALSADGRFVSLPLLVRRDGENAAWHMPLAAGNAAIAAPIPESAAR